MWLIHTVAVLHSTMRDSEVVAAIVAGNPEGLAEAYDRYASPLYTYCRSLLREPAAAAAAVQDTFVIAASRLAELRDRNRLRPWLYAVARNECHRRLRARKVQVATPLDEMPDVTDTSADVSGEAERDELRTLLRSAVRGRVRGGGGAGGPRPPPGGGPPHPAREKTPGAGFKSGERARRRRD